MNDNLMQALEALHENAGTLAEALEQMLTNRLDVNPTFIFELVGDIQHAAAIVAQEYDKL